MDLFTILNNIQTKKDLNWLNDVDDLNEIQPFILNKLLSMNINLQKQVRYLDKYTFYLASKQFIMLAWSIIPKKEKVSYNKYIKKNKELEDEYNFLIIKIRKHLEISDNDWYIIKKYYINDIENNKVDYFKSFGIDKKLWKKFDLDYKDIKNQENVIATESKNSLNKWF